MQAGPKIAGDPIAAEATSSAKFRMRTTGAAIGFVMMSKRLDDLESGRELLVRLIALKQTQLAGASPIGNSPSGQVQKRVRMSPKDFPFLELVFLAQPPILPETFRPLLRQANPAFSIGRLIWRPKGQIEGPPQVRFRRLDRARSGMSIL